MHVLQYIVHTPSTLHFGVKSKYFEHSTTVHKKNSTVGTRVDFPDPPGAGIYEYLQQGWQEPFVMYYFRSIPLVHFDFLVEEILAFHQNVIQFL